MKGPTRDHEEIRRWAAAHNAVPVEVSPYAFDSQPAILRFVLGKLPEDTPELREITWASFFAQFDLLGLSFVYDGDSQYELVYLEKKPEVHAEGGVAN